MATTMRMKRMARERVNLEKPSDDFKVLFKDNNILKFDAYVLGTSDTLFGHKFIKLRFEIVDDYPLKPPKCTFIQYSGGRIHPNLYTEGKVCLSILGTWEGEKWALAMTCETVMITIRSLLDNKPYLHEPHQRDNPGYNDYVQYSTWRCLFLDYLRNENEPELKAYLQQNVAQNADAIMIELKRQATVNESKRQFCSPYGQNIVVNYNSLMKDVQQAIDECKRAVSSAQSPVKTPIVVVDDDDKEVVEISAQPAQAGGSQLPKPPSKKGEQFYG